MKNHIRKVHIDGKEWRYAHRSYVYNHRRTGDYTHTYPLSIGEPLDTGKYKWTQHPIELFVEKYNTHNCNYDNKVWDYDDCTGIRFTLAAVKEFIINEIIKK